MKEGRKLTVFRDSVPAVHGKPSATPTVRVRLSNHQRNLSLDFRSMGIPLPPVTQVTTGNGTHMTLHHRNRSLDSALQRIPEVDVTPSPECEVVIVSSSEVMSSNCQQTGIAKTQRDELASLGSDDSGILCGSDTGSTSDGGGGGGGDGGGGGGGVCSSATRESSVEFLSNNQSQESLDDVVGDDECCIVKGQCRRT
ncbi:PREDICTED: uncharacterized protein LOC108568632, partial [Nicrophorus vespilloides]|uniref:Uncharacterized protein LOC108568632 n=1 Tax=Nicrophorus vespilloides TaxID=110193 RepID=A0ABM1NES6_NICVS